MAGVRAHWTTMPRASKRHRAGEELGQPKRPDDVDRERALEVFARRVEQRGERDGPERARVVDEQSIVPTSAAACSRDAMGRFLVADVARDGDAAPPFRGSRAQPLRPAAASRATSTTAPPRCVRSAERSPSPARRPGDERGLSSSSMVASVSSACASPCPRFGRRDKGLEAVYSLGMPEPVAAHLGRNIRQLREARGSRSSRWRSSPKCRGRRGRTSSRGGPTRRSPCSTASPRRFQVTTRRARGDAATGHRVLPSRDAAGEARGAPRSSEALPDAIPGMEMDRMELPPQEHARRRSPHAGDARVSDVRTRADRPRRRRRAVGARARRRRRLPRRPEAFVYEPRDLVGRRLFRRGPRRARRAAASFSPFLPVNSSLSSRA